MDRFSCPLFLLALITGLVGCGGPTKVVPVAVKGTIQLDGALMPEGEIHFVQKNEPVSVLEIKQGAYSGTAKPGKNRVEIYSFKKGPVNPNALSSDDPNTKVNFLPARFNAQSKLEADVTEGGANDFTFKVTSK